MKKMRQNVRLDRVIVHNTVKQQLQEDDTDGYKNEYEAEGKAKRTIPA